MRSIVHLTRPSPQGEGYRSFSLGRRNITKHLSSPRERLGEGLIGISIQAHQRGILRYAQYNEFDRGFGGKAPDDSSHLIIRVFLFRFCFFFFHRNKKEKVNININKSNPLLNPLPRRGHHIL